jgi:hypothetical protein
MQANRSNPYVRRGSDRYVAAMSKPSPKTDDNKELQLAPPTPATSSAPQPKNRMQPAPNYVSPPRMISNTKHRHPLHSNMIQRDPHALAYSLIQLKPNEELIASTTQPKPNADNVIHPIPQTRGVSLCRWLFVYIPGIMVLCVFVYVILEIIIKHLALRTLQTKMSSLPVIPPPPTPSSLIEFPKSEMPPPAMLPQWQTSNVKVPDPFDLRSLAFSGPANGYY